MSPARTVEPVSTPPDQQEFLRRARRFLRVHAPADGESDTSMFVVDPDLEADFVRRGREWQRCKYDNGFAGIAWPAEVGGRGLTPLEDALFRGLEHQHVSQWLTHNLGFENVGPAIIQHGTPGQRAQFIRPMLRGDQVWTLLMSEPGAGSDLAALRTRAAADGDGWVVNGQKVWSSRAHVADFGLLFARTDPALPKHRGIAAFIVDMRTPGITVRPLRQMNGAAHFNEVFLTDVWLPGEALLGDPGAGWAVAKTTLGSERNLLGIVRTHITTGELFELAARLGANRDPIARQRLARAYTADRILELHGARVRVAALRGAPPGQVASVMKLAYSAHVTATAELALDLLGTNGTLAGADGDSDGRWELEFTGAPATRIGGGTDEIQRNTIAERVLGLPAAPRTDNTVAFGDLPPS